MKNILSIFRRSKPSPQAVNSRKLSARQQYLRDNWSGGPVATLTPQEYSSLLIHLSERHCATRPRMLTDEQFRTVSLAIGEATRTFRPNGHNNTLEGLKAAIHHIITSNNLTERQWWDEVWRRGGYRDCLNYNAVNSYIAPDNPQDADETKGARKDAIQSALAQLPELNNLSTKPKNN